MAHRHAAGFTAGEVRALARALGVDRVHGTRPACFRKAAEVEGCLRERTGEVQTPTSRLDLRGWRGMGHNGSHILFVRYLNQGHPLDDHPHLSPQRATSLLLIRPENLTERRRERLEGLTAACQDGSADKRCAFFRGPAHSRRRELRCPDHLRHHRFHGHRHDRRTQPLVISPPGRGSAPAAIAPPTASCSRPPTTAFLPTCGLARDRRWHHRPNPQPPQLREELPGPNFGTVPSTEVVIQ